MIYLKSAVFGIVAVVLAVIVMAVAAIVLLMIKSRNLPPGQAYGFDPVSFFQNSLVTWVLLALVFLVGFVWEYRRAITRH